MVDASTEEAVRQLRSREQWVRYDSIVIGPGANNINPKWFNDFASFADADSLVWFDGSHTKSDGIAYSNLSGDTEDWAQLVYQTGIEFIAPLGLNGFDSSTQEGGGFVQNEFVSELPRRMAFNFSVGDTDQVLLVPGTYVPGGAGSSGQYGQNAGTLTSTAGQQGQPDPRIVWKWPEPLKLPAKSKITVSARIDKPIKSWLQSIPAGIPGSKAIDFVVPGAGASTVTVPTTLDNWYVIRVWHRGPRYVQLRGARSAS